MSFLDLVAEVLEPDLCTSCGACVAVCPQDLLSISSREPLPQVRRGPDAGGDPADEAGIVLACGSCSLCVDVCPGRQTAVAQSEQRMFGRTRTVEERWVGMSRSTYRAQASDPEILGAASAGGAATTLLATALRTGLIEAALVVGRDDRRPWVPAPRLVTTVAELLDCAQASYCIVPNLQVLREAPYRRIGVIGLPCQVQALGRMRNLPDPPPAVRKVTLTMELACSSNTRLEGTEHLVRDRLELPLADVRQMEYRAGGYPGSFTVRDTSNRVHHLPFHELVVEFKRFKTFRCLSCPDWWSGLADISVADGDQNVFRTSRNRTASPKSSLVVTRTSLGEALVRLSSERGELDVRPETFEAEESLGLQRKRHRYLRRRRQHPDRMPSPPGREEDVVIVLSDDEVIELMSPRGSR